MRARLNVLYLQNKEALCPVVNKAEADEEGKEEMAVEGKRDA